MSETGTKTELLPQLLHGLKCDPCLAITGKQVAGLGLVNSNLSHLQSSVSPMSSNSQIMSPAGMLSRQRLFVVVHKGVSEEMLTRLFRRLPGMEYCDLKKDRTTGRSKGFCYVNYSTPDSAALAVQQLNGAEFPPHSGHRIKVMFAEPLGAQQQRPSLQQESSGGSGGGGGGGDTPAGRSSPSVSMLTASSPSPVHTPQLSSTIGSISPAQALASMQESLASMSVQQRQAVVAAAAAHSGALEQMELAARLASMSPVSSSGACPFRGEANILLSCILVSFLSLLCSTWLASFSRCLEQHGHGLARVGPRAHVRHAVRVAARRAYIFTSERSSSRVPC